MSTAFSDVEPWPTTMPANVRAVIGNNKPPIEELVPAEFNAALLAERPDFRTKLADLIAASDRAEAHDDESLGRCGDLMKAYRACEAHINATHVAVKKPYLEGGRLVDAEKNGMIEPLAAAKRKVDGIGNAFVAKRDAEIAAERQRIEAEQRAAAARAAQAEQARITAEREQARAIAEASTKAERDAAIDAAHDAAIEAERAQAEAALAPAAPAKPEPVRSDAGATVSSKQEWKCEIQDYTKAMRHVRSDPKVKESIDAAIARLVRAGQRELTGVSIWAVARANFR